MDQRYSRYVVVKLTMNNIEIKNVKLQQRVHDLEWTILSCIELIKKGNNEKALKLLKKVIYEK